MNSGSHQNYYKHIDKILIATGIGYVTLPIAIFCFGWLKLPLAAVCTAFLAFFAWKQFSTLTEDADWQSFLQNADKACSGRAVFWIAICLLSALWVYLSGIGDFCFQNFDFRHRNAIFRDLAEQPWPVLIDLGKESDTVREVCGSGTVALTYYFSWWLPAALVSKLFHLGDDARNLVLYAWAVLGIIEIMYLLCRKMRKCLWWIPVIFIGFSGLDIIGALLRACFFENWNLSYTPYLEWWSKCFEYSANTTQLFWVFNQSVPVWVIAALFIQNDKPHYAAALASLSFAYSAWAAIGFIPFICAACFRKDNFLRNINLINIAVILMMMIVFGSFYASSNATDKYIGFHQASFYIRYFIIIFLEVIIYFIIFWKDAVKNSYYFATLISLIFIPLFHILSHDFIMRASIPALFMVALYAMLFISQCTSKIRKYIFIFIFLIGCVNPVTSIVRTINNTVTMDSYICNEIYSLTNMRTTDTELLKMTMQYLASNYDKSFFFRYLAKGNI